MKDKHLDLKKPKLKVRHTIQAEEGSIYPFTGTELQMPDHDFDIRLIRPDGTSLLVQWRVESETVDVCLCRDADNPDTRAIYVTDANLGKINKFRKRKDGSLIGQQITIL